jgi:hypothetical protein
MLVMSLAPTGLTGASGERAPLQTEAERRLVVRYHGGAAELGVVAAIAKALEAMPDPIYNQPLQVRFPE